MKMMRKMHLSLHYAFEKLAILAFIIFLLSVYAASVSAQDLPVGLQKINEYNQQQTKDIALRVSFVVAFIAGMLGILSPCILPFLPAYFSYTFKEKRNITLMTLIFFFGFSVTFVAMGLIAGFLGSTALTIVQPSWLVRIAGSAIIIFGIMTLFGKGISSLVKFRVRAKEKHDIPGTFLLGVFFAVGWSACLGPILAGILGIGAVLGNALLSALLLFFYSLGNLVPLFILSVFYDKLNLANSRLIRGKMLSFSLMGEEYHVHSTNLISGVLFLVLGGVMVAYKGTTVVNAWDILRTKSFFFSGQNALIRWQYSQIVGVIALVLFVAGISWFLWKRMHKGE